MRMVPAHGDGSPAQGWVSGGVNRGTRLLAPASQWDCSCCCCPRWQSFPLANRTDLGVWGPEAGAVVCVCGLVTLILHHQCSSGYNVSTQLLKSYDNLYYCLENMRGCVSLVSKYRYAFGLGLLQMVPFQHPAVPSIISSLLVNRFCR